MLSVLTPTIPGREELLRRCIESVSMLNIEHEHIIVPDDPPSGGPAAPIAKANARAHYPWRVILCDDDFFVPCGPEAMVESLEGSEYDFGVGIQGNIDQWGQLHQWEGTYPEPGATGAFIWHERLNVVAELPAESYFAGRLDQAGSDYVLLQRWIAAGARGVFLPIRLLYHRVG